MSKIVQSEKNRKTREKKRAIKGKASAPARGLKFAKPDERDPVAWLLAYLPNAYPLPFGQVHKRIVDGVVYAISRGGNIAIAAPRGTGKSTLVNGLLLWALLTGRTKFPVVVPWDDKAKRRALRFWSGELCFNVRLDRDYDDITAPFVASRGQANRLASVTQGGVSTGARLGITEGIIILPHGKGAIGSATINGNPRGLNYATINGRIIRPSFAVIDDPQDRETAKSKSRVRDTIEMIDSDVAGMAGPDERMSMVMPCTVIERGDVADHYLSNPDWSPIRVGQVVTWPKGWDKKDGKARRLWDEWNDLRQTGEREQDEGKAAVAFYLDNREAMTDGMAVSWEERYDRKRGQPDALYSAMHDFYVMGEHSFAAERQNDPIKQGVTLYTLTPDVIEGKTTDRKAGVTPEWSRLRVAATDINPSYGLSWSVLAFGADQTSAVLAYGVHRMNASGDMPKAQLEKALFEELAAHGRQLAALPCKPEIWVINAGGTAFDVVLRFCAESVRICGLQATGSTGRGARNYRPWGKALIGKPREQCHLAADPNGRKWIAWNADYWREQAQKAWTGTLGAPGSCSLPEGHHRTFAEQICREQLQGKAEIAGMMVWVWNTAPGAHDFGDCMSMAYMAAAWSGIGTSGLTIQPRKVARRPRSGGVVHL